MFERINREVARPGVSHHIHKGDLALSVERPGRRRMRGLTGDQGRGPGRRPRHEGHHPGHRGGRLQSRRGLVREAVLALLAEEPMHGYQLMTELGSRTGGRWRPSAGSIYPTLQQLEDEGLVTAEETDGRRVFALTEAGRVASATRDIERPWSRGDGDEVDDLRTLARELTIAATQVVRVGSPAARHSARAVLTDARRSLYRILADDAPATDATTAPSPD